MYAIKSKDLIATMRDLVELNVKHYKTDFSYDVQRMCYSAYRHEKETFLFMTREYGTYLFRFDDVLLRRSVSNTIVKHFTDSEDEHVRLYFVEVDGFHGNSGDIDGTVYEVSSYIDFVEWLNRNEVNSVLMHEYDDGSIIPETVSELIESKNLVQSFVAPVSKMALNVAKQEAERIRWDNPNFVDMAEYRYDFKI